MSDIEDLCSYSQNHVKGDRDPCREEAVRGRDSEEEVRPGRHVEQALCRGQGTRKIIFKVVPSLVMCDNIMLSLNITEYSYKSLLCVFEKCIESRIQGEKVFIFPLLI